MIILPTVNTSSQENDFMYKNEGLTCLGLIIKHYDKDHNMERLREIARFEEKRSLLSLSSAAEKFGFRARWVKLTCRQLIRNLRAPCILHWGPDRYIVIYPRSKWKGSGEIRCVDPASGRVTYTLDGFLANWYGETGEDGENRGNVMLLEPSFKFFDKYRKNGNRLSWGRMALYFRHHYYQIAGVVLALLITSFAQLIIPFLVQCIVDVGVTTQDLNYITVILLAQMMIVFSRLSAEFIRARLLLQVSSLVNLSIVSDFWIKITRLPIAKFSRYNTGDIIQRMTDNKKLQYFLTGPVLNTFFSTLNFIVFSIVLMMYKLQIFLIFGAGVLLYILWTRLFFRIRRKINYQIFHASARDNNATLQLVQGMEEIRLQNIEQTKRWEWESVQLDIFRLNTKNVSIGQLQQAGAVMINQFKDLILTFLVAKLVVLGQLTFGAMLAIQYIIGQLSSPIEQLINFIQAVQDAKINMDRLNEVHQIEDEEDENNRYVRQLPVSKTLRISNLSFSYPGENNEWVLNNIDLVIPEGKITAIVGASGSGKTTLLKLLLKFYNDYEGDIKIGDRDFNDISPSFWRSHCAAVLQDGFIFNDTIANNIALQHEGPEQQRLMNACRIANILPFIESLPKGFDTKLGVDGVGISQGQRQRLLIARAVYKDPKYLFFDESTNALDANNERIIMENMQKFFKNRTVIIVAHRLSTVKNADKIVMLDQGCIIEEGSHQGLANLKGKYFELVRNQLDLGN